MKVASLFAQIFILNFQDTDGKNMKSGKCLDLD